MFKFCVMKSEIANLLVAIALSGTFVCSYIVGSGVMTVVSTLDASSSSHMLLRVMAGVHTRDCRSSYT